MTNKSKFSDTNKRRNRLFIPILILAAFLSGIWFFIELEESQSVENPTAEEKTEAEAEQEMAEKENETTSEQDKEANSPEKAQGDEQDREENKDKNKEEKAEDQQDDQEKEQTENSGALNPKAEQIIEQLQRFETPIENAGVTFRDNHLPGAPREYRNGVHEGLDYYHHYVETPIEMGTTVMAVDDGEIIRADHDYTELDPDYRDELLNEAAQLGDTPEDTLDKLRGKQIWIEHEDGVVTRYAHMNSIEPHIVEGEQVEQGEAIGGVGNTGTGAAAEGKNDGPHLHLEIWFDGDDRFLGEEFDMNTTRTILEEIFNGRVQQ